VPAFGALHVGCWLARLLDPNPTKPGTEAEHLSTLCCCRHSEFSVGLLSDCCKNICCLHADSGLSPLLIGHDMGGSGVQSAPRSNQRRWHWLPVLPDDNPSQWANADIWEQLPLAGWLSLAHYLCQHQCQIQMSCSITSRALKAIMGNANLKVLRFLSTTVEVLVHHCYRVC